MKTIKRLGRKFRLAVTKKLGPLPRWAWILIAVAGVVVYRRRQAANQGGQGDTSQGNQAYTSPMSPPDLAYEPGGALPISPDGFSPGNGDTSGLLAILGALLAARNQKTSGGHGGHKRSKKPKPQHHHKFKVPKGDLRAPSGPHKPKAPKGYKAVGKGGGNWIFVPISKKARSSTGLVQSRGKKWSGGKQPAGHDIPAGKRAQTYAHNSRNMNRHMQTQVVGDKRQQTQRPVAAHNRPSKQEVRPAPRPSAPPKRNVNRRRAR